MSEAIQFDDDVAETTVEAPVEAVEQDEPQVDEVEATSEAPPEEQQEGARKAPEFSSDQQQFINEHIVAKQVAKRKEVERQYHEMQQELEKLRTSQPQEAGRPAIPAMPDPWEDNFEQRVQARDDAILSAAKWDAQQEIEQQYTQHQQQQRQYEAQQQLATAVESYTERAKGLGIEPNDLAKAGEALSSFEMDQSLVEHILMDDEGPAVTMHLARNLHEANELSRMSPIRAAAYIEREIRPKAIRNLKRRTSAPEPIENPKGSGAAEKSRGPKGAVYE